MWIRERLGDAGLGDLSDAATSQGILAAVRSCKRQRTDFLLELPGGTWSFQHLFVQPSDTDFRFLVSRTVTENIAVILSHPACGNLL